MLRFTSKPVAWIFVPLVLLSVNSRLLAQFDDLADQLGIHRFGYQGFQLVLQQKGIEQVTSNYERAFQRPQETVFIIFGDTNHVAGIGNRLRNFVERGGGLLLATDFTDNRIGPHFQIYPQAYRPTYDANSKNAFRGLRDCPLVTDFRRSHPLFSGVEKLATNRPGVIGLTRSRRARYQIDRLAHLSSRTSRRRHAFVVAQESKGKMIAIGDHSVFVNEMLFHEDNLTFTKNCVSWLFDDSRRKQAILICDGEVLPEFSFGDTVPPLPLDDLLKQLRNAPLVAPKMSDSSLRKMLNTLLTSMEDKDLFNQPLRSRASTAARARGFVMIAATIFLTIVFVLWAMRSPWRFTPKMQRKRLPSVHDRLLGGADDHSRGLYLAVRNLFSVSEDQLLNWQNSEFPTVHAKLSPVKKFFTKQKLRRLWKFAHAEEPSKMSKRAVRKKMKQIRELSGLREAGILRLE